MKRISIILFFLFVSINVFSQQIINNPDYGVCGIPGKLTKIEITDDAIIIDFYIKHTPGDWIFIPKQSYIQDINGGEKYYVTKTEGIPLAEKYFMPDSGEVNYRLYFPKLDDSIVKVDFGEANAGGNWDIYDIVINEKAIVSVVPNELRGDWLTTNGSNSWAYGFYTDKAIADKVVWNYKTVNKNGETYAITLEQNGQTKTIYAKPNKNGQIEIGETPQNLSSYSKKKINNPNYKLTNDVVYAASMFAIDSTTYSGVIKGFSPKIKDRTATIIVNNIFTGEQETYLVKIADDGSFSVKFPISHPQNILVRSPYNITSAFVEQGKEIFQLIKNDSSLFMGDCAQVNSDLKTLESINGLNRSEIVKTIGQMSPEAYKKMCFNSRDTDLEQLNTLAKQQFISKKALQIKQLDIEYGTLEKVLNYNMYRNSIIMKNGRAKTDADKVPYTDFTVEPL